MTDHQWDVVTKVIAGEVVDPLPVGFIIDSPWIPGWYGVKILDYLSDSGIWYEANMKAIREFPEAIFLPGFWSEFGMCTEPSAFGARSAFPLDEFPHAHTIPGGIDLLESLEMPDPRKDGLLPLVLNRLALARPKIEAAGHRIRFAVSRGPLNIASYLLGMTEFLTLLMTDPDRAERVVKRITAFVKSWLAVQRELFPSIDGVLLLDDVIGFMGSREFQRFGLPYFADLFSMDVAVKFLHNDAPCRDSAPLLPEMGVNLFNMGFDVTLAELKELTGNRVTLLGNIPPRDVLARGSAHEIRKAAADLVGSLKDRSRVIFSCGGGMPPGVNTENVRAFLDAIRESS
jgi:uroporphyrinogen decarboxylase